MRMNATLETNYMMLEKLRSALLVLIPSLLLMGNVSCISNQPRPEKEVRAEIVTAIQSGGKELKVALSRMLNGEHTDLIRHVFPVLIESNNYAESRWIIKTLLQIKVPLENYAPDWHEYIGKFVRKGVPDDILLDVAFLAQRAKEHRLMGTLNKMSSHPSTRVRFAAFKAMAAMGNDSLIPLLLKKLISDRPVERIHALEGASIYHDNRMHTFMLKALDDPSPAVRIFAIRTIEAQPDAHTFAGLIGRVYSSDKDPEVRKEALESITRSRWRTQSVLLYRAVADESATVRLAAIRGIVNLNEVRGAPSISRQLLYEYDPVVKREAIEALMTLRNSGGGDGIIKMIEKEPNSDIRLLASVAAGYLREKSALRSLVVSLKNDPDERVRMESANSLGLMGDSYATDSLEQIIASKMESYDVRSAALASLLEIQNRDLLSSIIRLNENVDQISLKSQLSRMMKELSD